MLVGAEDEVVPLPQHGARVDLSPCLQMTTTETFREFMHQVKKAKFCQQVGDKLFVQVLVLIQVHI